jgi:MFS family permease
LPRAPKFREIFFLTSFKDRNLFAACQAGLVNNLNDGMSWGIFPLFFVSFGLSVERIGILKAVYPATWGILQIATGPLSDRWGRKGLITGGMWIQAAGLFLTAATSHFEWWLVGSLLLGIGTAMVYPSLIAAVSDASHPSWRARSLSVYRFWRDLGYAIGALSAGIIADQFGLAAAIIAIAALTFVSGVVVAVVMRQGAAGAGPAATAPVITVGTIQSIEEIGALAREHGIRFHTDAAQSVGKISTNVHTLGVDLLSIAGHKLYAPKGVGALYVRSGVELDPLIHGAGHELGRRAGTESALLAVGLGTACAIAADLAPMERVQALRDRFWQALQDRFGDHIVRNGDATHRLPNTLNVSFVGKIGGDILGQLRGVAASTGSACHSGRIELSPVLAAMGVPERIGMGAIRFSLGRFTAPDEIDDVVARLAGFAPA